MQRIVRGVDLGQIAGSTIRQFVANAVFGVDQTMNRNILYLVIGILAVAAVVFGYQLYQERQKTTGIEINVGKSGISIEKK